MSRRDTIAEESYRVQVIRPDGIHTHGSQFSSIESSRAYYDALDIPGSRKELQRRSAGKSRYETLELSNMSDPAVDTCDECCGDGEILEQFEPVPGGGRPGDDQMGVSIREYVRCPVCKGTGVKAPT